MLAISETGDAVTWNDPNCAEPITAVVQGDVAVLDQVVCRTLMGTAATLSLSYTGGTLRIDGSSRRRWARVMASSAI